MALIFLSTLIVSMIVMLMLSPRKPSKKDTERKLEIIAVSRRSETDAAPLALVKSASTGPFAPIADFTKNFRFGRNLEQLIEHSGSTITLGTLVGSSVMIAVAAAMLSHMMVGMLPVDLIAFVVGGLARWGLLKFKRSRRMNAINTALPDAIDLLSRALRAGHSVASAVEVVAEQSAEPLASEFGIVSQQQKCGVSFRDAVLALSERVPLKDLHFLITAILVQKETGGDLTDVLDRTAHVIRDRIRIEGEVKTYTAQGRLTGCILAMLPVVMLVLINIISPGYSHPLFADPLGQKLLYGSGTLIVIGGLIIRQIVNIKV